MADTRGAENAHIKKFRSDFFRDYFQENRFKSEMGTSENAIIQVSRDLTGGGKTVQFNLGNRMTGSGVTGTTALVGNEEQIQFRTFSMDIIKRRNAFVTHEQDRHYNAVDLLAAGRSFLQDWAQENTRDQIITAMGSINGVAYESATEAQKDAWLVDNADRVLFGAAKSNNSSNDHSASLANVDGSNDKLTTGALDLLKEMALVASPKIRPMRSATSGRRYFCAYVHPYAFRDLRNDSTMQQSQRDVSLRMQNEKLFNGGDMEWNGIIIKELDDIPVLSGVGASSIDVAPVFFCGAQAVAYGIGKPWYVTGLKEDDYGDKQGYAINEMGNFAKLRFGTGSNDTDDYKDHGMVTGYFAAVASS